ncbi:nucleoporin GLE1 [Podospora fimiseda]|uniref:mRNA export factor GLE1 n=1 Tax=Podospora fimiseda TaxID=252190 RepID=A0AAN7BVE7_9PEZI|nr:nucleoporin GLE1 [Podospora fimiseda]
MTYSSPSRWVNPNHHDDLARIFDEPRNSEARHAHVLKVSETAHTRLREDAEKILQEALLREETERILAEKRREQDRLLAEQKLAEEHQRLNELRKKKIEIPPLLPEPKPGVAPVVNGNFKPAPSQTTPTTANIGQPSVNPFGKPPFQAVAAAPAAQATAIPNKQPTEPAKPPVLGINALLNGNLTTNGAVPAIATPKPVPTPPTSAPQTDRYSQIHKNLKILRKSMMEQAKVNRALKERMGDMRREIRKSVGQLTGGAPGVNKTQQQKIVTLLREALSNRVDSQPMDPSNFVLKPRNPMEGTLHNQATLPSLFLYLLNVFSKAVISQFINEASARPETADPVGVCVAAAFSEPDFLWRGESLIDILLAKFRIVCPVLFGYRGSEKTEQGRQRLGWWKDGGHWIPDQQHMDRMTGLGAGFAAISLRNFTKSKKENPYPARNYWAAMVKIVRTPPSEISNTQCVVLKAMIQNYEAKFIDAFGNAAVAALRAALIQFPAKAPEKSAAVNSLHVLAQVLKRDTGLNLG